MSKPKYRKLPRALQSELAEYSSLIRALGASETLDISQQILRPAPNARNRPSSSRNATGFEDVDGSDDGEFFPPIDDAIVEGGGTVPPSSTFQSPAPTQLAESSVPPDDSGVEDPHVEGPSVKKCEESPIELSPAFKEERDKWTRWPLRDPPEPSFSLEDEIASIVSRVLRQEHRGLPTRESMGRDEDISQDESEDDDDDDDDIEYNQTQDGGDGPQAGPSGISKQSPPELDDGDEDWLDEEEESDEEIVQELDEYSSMFVPQLSDYTRHLLSSMLALLSKHTPPRPASMQNRIEPMNWKDVLQVLSAHGDPSLIDGSLLKAAAARLQAIYPENHEDDSRRLSEILGRHSLRKKARDNLSGVLKRAEDDLFACEPPSASLQIRQRPKRKTRSNVKASAVSPQLTPGSPDSTQD